MHHPSSASLFGVTAITTVRAQGWITSLPSSWFLAKINTCCAGWASVSANPDSMLVFPLEYEGSFEIHQHKSTVPPRKGSWRVWFSCFHSYLFFFCQYIKSKDILLTVHEHDICGQENSVLITQHWKRLSLPSFPPSFIPVALKALWKLLSH